ncbi:glycyl-tRNA synthetase, beta subunit [Geobacter metallireducens RCH3]|uniref:Glycine--tRNA ligase beta subunit n=1 Tax=Geobacter metallireducens (strain ATCC 53774 / DSM 7210 / GS-15) TaxID=269799 RepID=SYGB_GEOMG|nr:glycine--tRNA ligase subunit beta [Geobacter metallireducens]Q39RG5.1 RecName: Full=Glycine--tRNA ligase beta subunit; AltName: Full=Glycyl-tRNA synthetase beta subunit; Short=GlyRS [Geobacter metallireducens GS-15]ABB33159.1 glycyl-tRNA synthetase, beta subunit [Geobacter metallireducens GS-15]EHP87158.1 glycyl-tRNA synthetase, beta subunit [Geobacter metallireducens RCH3]
MKELFLEIGTEEIPAGFIPKAMADMEALLAKELENARISFDDIRTLGTPRRLALTVKGLPTVQPDAEITAMGPARNVAFDAEGKPTRAAEGFARGQGVDVASLTLVATEKGEYVAAVRKESGRPVPELLAEILPRLVANIPFRKSMRWGALDVRFARPIHWIVALFDGVVVPFTFGNIESGTISRGHRFMANQPFPVRDFAHYLEECERHFVIPDPERRQEIIRREIHRVAKAAGGHLLPDEGLLEEVSFLCEYPSAVHGTFSAEFLKVPREVLITSMRSHQRYFSIVDDAGKLMPGFITINNTLTEDPTVVVKGNERVLRARLSDARFFFEEDQKVKLETRVESLKNVVYQQKLGTSFEKMERFRALAEGLADLLNPAVKVKVSQAAFLCKADLVSGMVGEFPEVQGIMGREYALIEGEDAEVAAAIAEHYLPTQAGGELPASDIGAFVSMADKLDTICGCFGVGLIPTGSADPYALRRSALGIINIILDKGYRLSLEEQVDKALGLLAAKLTRPAVDVKADVLEFFRGRFVNLMADRHASDAVDAAVAAGCADLVDAAARIAALSEFRSHPDFEPLAVAFKRVGNIVKEGVDAPVDTALFQDAAEGLLNDAVQGVAVSVREKIATGAYLEALTEIAALRGPVDTFFDKVMVMAEDERVRTNRLALLTGIARMLGAIADFAKIAA